MAAVRASTRVSIAWNGGEPYEDTDTLVLTIRDFSLDLRVFISGPQKGQIDWSTVAEVSEAEGSTEEKPILKWDHLIDSRPPSGIDDEGTFTTLDGGDVAESGRMFNPDTGDIEAYVEIWRRFPNISGAPYCVLELVKEEGEEGLGWLGRVGVHDLGCGIGLSGEYIAWRDLNGENLYEFGSGASKLPRLPVELPEDWQEGSTYQLDGRKFVVRVIGTRT